MRLIDADDLKEPIIKLLELAVKQVNFTSVNDPCHKMYVAREDDLSMFIDLIDNAPTVEITEEQAIDKLHETGWIIKHDKEMTERSQGEWIPVSERLPEENGEYLITREAYIDRENRNMVFVIDIANFTINYRFNNGFHKANTVIAWKPLPEPYKEDSKE